MRTVVYVRVSTLRQAQAQTIGFCQLSGQNHKMLRFVIVSDLQNIVVLPRKLTEPTRQL
jgi:DNA invertase Pin-like site-specific DNA recombinase